MLRPRAIPGLRLPSSLIPDREVEGVGDCMIRDRRGCNGRGWLSAREVEGVGELMIRDRRDCDGRGWLEYRTNKRQVGKP